MKKIQKQQSIRTDPVCSFLLRKLPEGLRTQFKILCIENNLSMEEALTIYMKKSVEENELLTYDDL